MKLKLFATGSITIFLFLFFIFSCNKREGIATASPETVAPNILIQSAKAWHSAQITVVNTLSSSNPNQARPMLPPIWKESKLLTLKNGKTFLVVASPMVKVSDESKAGVIRKFVFEVKGNEITQGVIVEMYGTREYINSQRINLLEKYLDNSIPDFTGSIIYYSLNYKYLGSASFELGKRQQNVETKVMFDHGEHREGKNQSSTATLDVWQTCTDWYTVGWYNGYISSITYINTTCEYSYDSELGGNSYWTVWSWGGGSSNSDPTGSGNAGVNSINNTIEDPCLNDVYYKLVDGAYKDRVSQMLQNFYNSDQINITITANNSLPGNTYGQAYGDYNAGTYNIELNENVLKQCSQEFIASIYFHEVIHVYLKAYQQTWDSQTSSQHLEMLSDYFDDLTTAVTNAFPSLPKRDAYCMILDCIENSDEDPNFSQALFNSVKAGFLHIMQLEYPELASESEIETIADLYREGGVNGTRICY